MFGIGRSRSDLRIEYGGRGKRLRSAPMNGIALKAPADGFVSAFPDTRFDAILVVSFGGPEGMDDVIPFLENVTRGRNVPRERLEEVAHHYELFDGVSPINAQNRALIAALRVELDDARHRAADLLRQPQLGIRFSPTRCGRWPPTASSARSRSSPPRTRRIRAAASTVRISSTRRRRWGRTRRRF